MFEVLGKKSWWKNGWGWVDGGGDVWLLVVYGFYGLYFGNKGMKGMGGVDRGGGYFDDGYISEKDLSLNLGIIE